jgi:F0F1-type ATP synthase membrane subunit b/b'
MKIKKKIILALISIILSMLAITYPKYSPYIKQLKEEIKTIETESKNNGKLSKEMHV